MFTSACYDASTSTHLCLILAEKVCFRLHDTPNSSHCPHFHSLLEKPKNSQKSQAILVNLKKMWKAATQYLWLLQEYCKNHIFTSLSILPLNSFLHKLGFSPDLVRFLTLERLASAYQRCTHNICFEAVWSADEKAALSEYQVSHSESAFISFSSLGVQEEQRRARGLSWALYYFPTQISCYYSRSLPKLFFLLLGAKSRMTIIYHRINSL